MSDCCNCILLVLFFFYTNAVCLNMSSAILLVIRKNKKRHDSSMKHWKYISYIKKTQHLWMVQWTVWCFCVHYFTGTLSHGGAWLHTNVPTSMFPRAFVNLRVEGAMARLTDLRRLLLGLSGRSPVDEFLFPFSIDSSFSFFRAISSLCCLQL